MKIQTKHYKKNPKSVNHELKHTSINQSKLFFILKNTVNVYDCYTAF